MDRNPNDRIDETPEREGEHGMLEGERLHDREDMSAREGMASTDDGPMERGERQGRTGGGASRV